MHLRKVIVKNLHAAYGKSETQDLGPICGTRDPRHSTWDPSPGTQDPGPIDETWDPPYGTLHLGLGTLYVGART